MDKKPLIVVSICAVVLLVVGSLNNVVGYQTGITNTQICKNGLRDDNDTTPPVTTIYFVPPEPNGLNGWYVSDIEITLEATDDISGVDFIKYLLDDNDWMIYTSPLIIKSDGFHRITYYAVDKAGNVEQPSDVVRFKLDQTKPIISIHYTWEKIGCRKYVIIVTATCTDATSGIAKVEFYFNGVLQETVTGAGPEFVWAYDYAPLPSVVVKAIAYDNAGWTNFAELINTHSSNAQSHGQWIQKFILFHQIIDVIVSKLKVVNQ